MPEFRFDVIDQIPEELKADAKKGEDGKFVLNLVPKAKIDEFREKNISLAKEHEVLTSKYSNLTRVLGNEDPDKFGAELVELRKTKQLVDDGKLSESGKVEEVLAERTKKMRENYEDELRKLAGESSEWKRQYGEVTEHLKGVQVDNYIRAAIHDNKSGAIPEAEAHILLEARKVFKIEGDGNIIPKNGEATLYGSDGINPMTPLEWLKGLQKILPYLFKGSVGGGASGGQMSNFGMSKEEFNKLPAAQRLAMANNAAAAKK